MNKERLKVAETAFLASYPEGFDHPEMIKISKKHQIGLRVKQAQEFFAPGAFAQPQQVVANMVKTISRSSMVSVFEKTRLKRWVGTMSLQERESYAFSLYEILHGDQSEGFELMKGLLEPGGLTKWSLMTILPY